MSSNTITDKAPKPSKTAKTGVFCSVFPPVHAISAPPKPKLNAKNSVQVNAYLPHSFLFLSRPCASRHNSAPAASFKGVSKSSGKRIKGYIRAKTAPQTADRTILHHRKRALAASKERLNCTPSKRKFSKNAYSIYTVINLPPSQVIKLLYGKRVTK